MEDNELDWSKLRSEAMGYSKENKYKPPQEAKILSEAEQEGHFAPLSKNYQTDKQLKNIQWRLDRVFEQLRNINEYIVRKENKKR